MFFSLIMAFSLVASVAAYATMTPPADVTGATDVTTAPQTSEADESTSPEDTTATDTPPETSAPDTTVADETTAAPSTAELLAFRILTDSTAKSAYLEGESFDPTGYTLEVTYIDGTKAIIPSSEINYSPKGALSSSDKKITITYMDMSRTTSISVSAFKELKLSASKTEYLALDFFDPSTLTVKVVFDNNSEQEISYKDCSFSPSITDPLSSKTDEITLSYTYLGKTITGKLSIDVKPIVSIEIGGLEDTSFYECNYFAPPASMVVTAYYDAEKTISSVIEPQIPLAEELLVPDESGHATLTAIADGIEQSFTINVIAIKDISVDMGSTPLKYYYGEVFSPANIKVTAIYTDETTADISANVTYTYPDVIAHGSTITAVCAGHNIELPITLPVGSLLIVREPTKTEYLVGEKFNHAGLFLGLQYDDNSDNKILTSDLYTIPDVELEEGMEYVTANYYGATINIPIVVGNKTAYTSISITQVPTHLTYISGQTLNTEGLIVHAYIEGEENGIIIPIEDLIFSPSLDTLLTSDDEFFTIKFQIGVNKYLEATCPISVEEKVISNITVTKQPAKTEYKEGDKFDTTGMEVTIVYNDGTTAPVTNYSVPTTAFILTETGDEPVKVHIDITYGEYTCPVTVTVTPAEVDRITLAASPKKSTYYVGEIFDPDGLKIVLMYKDGTLSTIVPDGAYSFYPAGALTLDTKKVVVSFRGLEVNVPIMVIDPNAPETSTPPEDTDPIIPPITQPNPDDPDVTDAPDDPPTSSAGDETTAEPTGTSEITTLPSPDDTTNAPQNSGDTTTNQGSSGGSGSGLLIMWIVIIAIIVVALVVLIIYYKKNFT